MRIFTGRGSFPFLVKTLLIFSILFLLSGCAAVNRVIDAVSSQFTSLSNRYLQEGDRLAGEQRQPEALLAYRQAVAADPNNLPAIKKLALAYQEEGRRRMALDYLRDAQKLQPGDTDLPGLMAAVQPPSANAPIQLLWSAQATRDVPVGYCLWQGKLFVTYEKGLVAAFDATSGKILWQVSLPAQASSAPAASNGMVFAGSQAGNLFALSTSDGKILWNFPTKAPIYASPAVTDTQVFLASSDGSLYALTLANGKLLWSFRSGAALRSTPLVAGTTVYFGSADARLYAVDMVNGAARWKNGILTQGAVESQPALNDNRVVFGSGDGKVYSLAVDSGGQYWHYATPDSVYATPLIDAGLVYVASSGLVLAAVDELNGKPAWENSTLVAITTTPALSANTIYYTGPDSPYLFAVDRQIGKDLWKFDTGDWISAGPLYSQGIIFILGKDGTLLAYH
jgi:outer membrane protein assembly factor BamB